MPEMLKMLKFLIENKKMDSYKHQLQKYSGSGSRYKCPKCQKTGKFVRFIDTESGKQIADNVGKCERINSCGYILKPGDYLYNTGSNNKSNQNVTIYSKQVEISLIPEPLFQKSFVREKSFQQLTEANSLVKFMSDKFGSETVEPVIRKYFIGTSKYRWKRHNYISEPGATVFYQVDGFNRVRTGKIMLYDPNTGERIKEPFNHIQWVHKLLDNKDYNLQQCLFGEHLLKEDNTSPVAITESEKTALFASLYYPQFIWLATGGVENFKLIEKSVSLLKRRKVHLFPDLGQYELWHTKALNMGSKIEKNYLIVSAYSAFSAFSWLFLKDECRKC